MNINKPERPINKVIEAVQKLTPSEFERKEEFFRVLDKIKSSSCYAAPEISQAWWAALVHCLEDFLGPPATADWKTKICHMVNGLMDYKEVLGEA